jgi:hypothetical protein
MNIDDLVKAIHLGKVQVTDHADEEAQEDNLEYETIFSQSMVEKLLRNIQRKSLIPAVLSLENLYRGEPIHSVWAYDRRKEIAVLITVYRPDPARWFDWRIRRK